jgi:Ca2+-binding EF-hand superfamily protein
LMDKNEDGLVTLLELRKFNVAVYKDLMLTQDEFRMQTWMLRNLYSKDLLGSDDAFDREEFITMKRADKATPAAPLTTTLKPEIFSKKPFEFWDLNKDGEIAYEELYRFKQQ